MTRTALQAYFNTEYLGIFILWRDIEFSKDPRQFDARISVRYFQPSRLNHNMSLRPNNLRNTQSTKVHWEGKYIKNPSLFQSYICQSNYMLIVKRFLDLSKKTFQIRVYIK